MQTLIVLTCFSLALASQTDRHWLGVQWPLAKRSAAKGYATRYRPSQTSNLKMPLEVRVEGTTRLLCAIRKWLRPTERVAEGKSRALRQRYCLQHLSYGFRHISRVVENPLFLLLLLSFPYSFLLFHSSIRDATGNQNTVRSLYSFSAVCFPVSYLCLCSAPYLWLHPSYTYIYTIYIYTVSLPRSFCHPSARSYLINTTGRR